MELPDRTLLRITRIGPAHPRRVGRHGPHRLLDIGRLLAQGDGVAVGLGHFLPVQTRHLGRLGQQRHRLGQDDAPAAFQIAEQPFAIGQCDVGLSFQQRMSDTQRLLIALLLIAAPQPIEELGVLLAHLALGLFRLLLEAGLATVDVIETPRDLARQLDMGDLVLADRDLAGLVHEDVRALEQRITEKTVGRKIALLELLLLVLVARHSLEPTQGRDHGEQQMQLGVLGHARLDEECCRARIDPGRQPVDHHLAGARRDDRGILVVRRQGMPVGDEEETLILVLQLQPVLQDTVIVPQMETARRTHPGEDARVVCGNGSQGMAAS